VIEVVPLIYVRIRTEGITFLNLDEVSTSLVDCDVFDIRLQSFKAWLALLTSEPSDLYVTLGVILQYIIDDLTLKGLEVGFV